MSDTLQKNILIKLLLQTRHSSRLWAALVALCVGTTLLLISTLIWWNFHELLFGKVHNDSLGSTFMVIGKKVTNETMKKQGATIFADAEIEALKKVPQVEDLGTISSNRFPVYAMMGGSLGFATDMPLESVPDKFIDKLPEEWKWEPGSTDLPIIISTQFLNIYNYVFAPSQNLPQLSESSVKALAIRLKAGGEQHNETFMAHVVGFSDRIGGAILVPQSFIDYGNKTYNKSNTLNNASSAPTQIILKTKDPSDTRFADFLQKNNYTTSDQNLKWSRVRAIVEVVTTCTGILALLLMGISTLVFILFIELTIAKAQNSISLLMQIGYSPHYLSTFMTKRFLPLVLGAVSISMIITLIAQYFTSIVIKQQSLELPTLPGLPVWGAFIVSTFILLILIYKAIGNAIKK